MINHAQLSEKLIKHYGSVVEVRPNIFRASEKFGDREFAIRYFDLTNKLLDVSLNLNEYQEDLMAETLFGAEISADLRWNHYLYIIANTEATGTAEFFKAKSVLEADKSYARKKVITEQDLNVLLSNVEHTSSAVPADIATQWLNKLEDSNLSFVLDDSVTAPEAVRLIKAGNVGAMVQKPNSQSLSEAEKDAGNKFLKTLHIDCFRKFPSVRSYDFSHVNLIVGRNGVGKTSLLEAIEFLYCGHNRRSGENSALAKVTGTFWDSNFTLKSTTSASSLRARNSKWYSKVDLKKVTLSDSFSKFNFLDTDAAVELSSNNDSEERLKKDVARLLLGPEVEKLADKLSRVSEKLLESIRTIEKDLMITGSLLKDAKARLRSIQQTPTLSDSIFTGLQNLLLSNGWKTVPSDKHQANELQSTIQSLIVAAKRIVRFPINDQRSSAEALLDQRKMYEAELKSAEELALTIKNAVSEISKAKYRLAEYELRRVAIENIYKFVKFGFEEKKIRRSILESRKIEATAKLVAFNDDFSDPVIGSSPKDSLFDLRRDAFESVRNLEAVINEKKINIKSIETTMESIAVLRQRLLSVASEMMEKVGDPDHCPVCKTHFEGNTLKLLIQSEVTSPDSDLLTQEYSDLQKYNDELFISRGLLVRFDALIDFIGGQQNISFDDAINIVKITKIQLEKDQQELEDIDRVLNQLAIEGMNESLLRENLLVLQLPALPTEGELSSIQENDLKEVAELKDSCDQNELKLKELRARLATIFESELDENIEHNIEIIKRKIADLNSLVAAKETIFSVLHDSKSDYSELDMQLSQALNQCSQLMTEINAEKESAKTQNVETKNISKLEKQKEELSNELSRVHMANNLIKTLIQEYRDGVFSEQVLNENAKSIGSIFSAIHMPNEFKIDLQDTFKLVREGSKQAVTLRQMSTGQRSAYALSLFLSMNNRLVSGPPVILMDDPVAHIDDLNILSFLDYLRNIAIHGKRQIFFATADEKLAGLFRQKFRFLGNQFTEFPLSRDD